MQKKYYEILVQLAEIAEEYGSDKYQIIDFTLGTIPFKNGENKAEEVGTSFLEISRWLLDEAENNFGNQYVQDGLDWEENMARRKSLTN